MKKEEIFLWDWKRIVFGDAPAEFMIEVFMRTLIIYTVLLVVARLLGKRMSGQLTLTETAVMVTLGAIVSAPMQIPDRGICLGIAALTGALAFQRGINLWGIKNSRFEKLSQGSSSMLVKDGVMLLSELQKTRFSRQELFAALRSRCIYNLGEVKRVYIEGCGITSIFRYEEGKPGLPLLPESDAEIHRILKPADSDLIACNSCGFTIKTQDHSPCCPNCKSRSFSPAVLYHP